MHLPLRSLQDLTGDARPRFFELCSRSGGDAREAMTVGCKPTMQDLTCLIVQSNPIKNFDFPKQSPSKGF